MMASALMGLSSFNEGWHWFEYFVSFSSLTIDEIISIQFEKIMIFKTLFFGPMTFFIIGVVRNILSDSFFLFFVRLWHFKAFEIDLLCGFPIEIFRKNLALIVIEGQCIMIDRRLFTVMKKKILFYCPLLVME